MRTIDKIRYILNVLFLIGAAVTFVLFMVNGYGNGFVITGKTTFRQDNTETLMRVEYYVDLNGNPRDSVSFDSQRGIYFQFNK